MCENHDLEADASRLEQAWEAGQTRPDMFSPCALHPRVVAISAAGRSPGSRVKAMPPTFPARTRRQWSRSARRLQLRDNRSSGGPSLRSLFCPAECGNRRRRNYSALRTACKAWGQACRLSLSLRRNIRQNISSAGAERKIPSGPYGMDFEQRNARLALTTAGRTRLVAGIDGLSHESEQRMR